MSKFFIDRPIFAWVIAIVIMVAGVLSIFRLPIEQYPPIAPPTVNVSATYPGASAVMLENTVTQVIEQKMSGLDYLRYMSSTSDSAGNVSISLTFEPEANPDIAQVQVQNKLQLAMPSLPEVVQTQGVVVSKSATSFLMVASLVSRDNSVSQGDLNDLLTSRVQDPISRVPGVGEVTVFGAQHALRIWLDPNRLVAYDLTTKDVINAVRSENVDVSAGQLGAIPAVEGQLLNATVLAQSRMETPEQFENILLKVTEDGGAVHLRDVARIEVGSESYAVSALMDGSPAAALGIKLATSANALETADAVRARLASLSEFFPAGVEVTYPYDTTPFVSLSIEEVVKTLIEAVILVFVVMFVFLQNFRATLIPTITIPVVLLGTFGVLAASGFTINTLTMFAMVLAIGLLVDDAIVVVENVERIMSEEGLPPREATRKSMGQITGALVGIALVLSAVFVPMAFMEGSTGAIYRQFSLTLVSSMTLSVVVALILTPALCATILKPVEKGHGYSKKGPFGWFNRGFDKTRSLYSKSVQGLLHRSIRVLVLFVVLVGGLLYLFNRLPGSFLPDEDQGLFFIQVQGPATTSRAQTSKILERISNHLLGAEKDSVTSVLTLAGFNFSGRGQNMGMVFVRLKDWSERTTPDKKVPALIGRTMGFVSGIQEARIFAFAPPAVITLGNASGFELQLQDQGGLGHDALMAANGQLLGMANQTPGLMGVRPNGLDDTPQLRLDVDREKAKALGINLDDINSTLSAAWGSSYINDFIENGRVKKVFAQADAPFRMVPEDFGLWRVRNEDGQMVPLSVFTESHWEMGSPQLKRFNGIASRTIQGAAAPGYSSGEAMNIMEGLLAKLPPGIGYQWSGLSYEERLVGSQAPMLYALSVLVVFLCLAALYESWSTPFAVLLAVPLGVLGAVLAVSVMGLSNDVYFQVGLLTTIGLSAKNAILIIEFAKELYEQGRSLIGATIEACRQRLRPILMTSFAFILGVLPLATSNGAGSGAQNAIGVGVMGGMISATILGVFFIPVFFASVQRLFGRNPKRLPLVEPEDQV
ncbi:efflux RND transporter permease subunit [Rhodospirillum sp. A1_3_36]|uniref:efflux RND transporter permease subunit n=1 Tax=Rhodospirillum sp. A1_3_36 TaxID=3391666 RepID=UPI0039A76F7B